jgi:hypothetical protein
MLHVTGRLLTRMVADARYEAVTVGDTITCVWRRTPELLDAPVHGRDEFAEQLSKMDAPVPQTRLQHGDFLILLAFARTKQILLIPENCCLGAFNCLIAVGRLNWSRHVSYFLPSRHPLVPKATVRRETRLDG